MPMTLSEKTFSFDKAVEIASRGPCAVFHSVALCVIFTLYVPLLSLMTFCLSIRTLAMHAYNCGVI